MKELRCARSRDLVLRRLSRAVSTLFDKGANYLPDINRCGQWSATLHSHKLTVNGQCTFPTPGYKVHLKKKEPQGLNPAILLLEKTVVPPTGIEPDHVTSVPVTFDEQTTAHYTEVEILPDGTKIKVKQAASA